MQAERRYRESSEVLGCGAFGVVRRATDLRTGAPCVVKRVPFASGSAERESHWSVLEEARLLRWLHHPNICRISDYWESNRNGLELCLVLELCEGGDLKTRLRCANGPLAPREVASIGQQLLRALQYCHARRVLHRDVKPANVLLARDGSVRLSDFGAGRRHRWRHRWRGVGNRGVDGAHSGGAATGGGRGGAHAAAPRPAAYPTRVD